MANVPATTDGYSTRSGTSCEQARLAVDDAADAALQPLRLGVELAGDLVVPLAALEDDEVLEQPRAVFVERAHLDGAPGAAAGRQEAVAVGDRAGRRRPAPARSAPPGVRAIVNGTTRPP